MTNWRVRVEVAPPNGAPPDSTLAQIREQLHEHEHDPYVVVEYDGHLAVSITVTAGTRRAAFDHGDKAVTAALTAVGLAGLDVVDIGVLTEDEYQRRQRQPRVPRLAGAAEAAEIMNVSQSRVKVIAQDYADQLPLVTKFAGEKGVKVWLAQSWEHFDQVHERKRTGRPPGTGRKKADT